MHLTLMTLKISNFSLKENRIIITFNGVSDIGELLIDFFRGKLEYVLSMYNHLNMTSSMPLTSFIYSPHKSRIEPIKVLRSFQLKG